MPTAPFPPDETDRVAALYAMKLMDTPPEERFDRLSRLAVSTFHVPIAYVALIDSERQWFKSACGLDIAETTRGLSLCGYTLLGEDALVCPDATQDPRFCDNPFVTGRPGIRFYMGHPLKTPGGYKVGTFCVAGTQARPVTPEEVERFRDLAAVAETEINLLDIIAMQKELAENRQELIKAYQEVERNSLFIREVFGRYVTDQVASALLESPDKLKLGGEKRVLTVLMSDLRNFTGLSELLPPEKVVHILNRYLGRMVSVIGRHRGTIDEFIGDAILVIFGAPLPQEDHALRAVACAVDMQLAMEEFNAELRADGLPEQAMGIGINTGEIIVGNIGSDTRMKYSVVGSPVNMAARIESFTVGGQILISEATLRAAGEAVRVDGHLRVKVKGFELPVSIYEVGGVGGGFALELPRPHYGINP